MQIEPEALAALFETLIVPIENSVGKEVEKETITIQEGEHDVDEKKLSLIFAEKPSQEEEAFLSKILQAIQIKEDEFEKKFHVSVEICKEMMQTNKTLMVTWGIELPGNEKYKLIQNHNAGVIVCDDLGKIQADTALKTKLWNCLKAIFVK